MAQKLVVALALASLTFALYSPVSEHDFLSLDDRVVVVDNPLATGGLSWDGVKQAFTTPYMGNWIPLTYVSLQLDRSLHGGSARGTLLANAALHALGTALLFVALVALSGAVWPSAFAAAVFGLHPLHVESVAWASERKDVLSGVFWMLTLLAYAGYVRAPSPWRYLAVLAALGAGLLAKPMLVTLPFVLLLLDYWPLERLGRDDGSAWPDPRKLARCALEKAPLLALAAAASLVTLHSQGADQALYPAEVLTLPLRLMNACLSYVAYLGDAVWPAGLAAFYPHPLHALSRPLAFGAAVLLLAITAAALRLAPRAPQLLVGWLWYLGTLVPVIGLVQVGMQARADRYTYLPLVGLSIAVAWSGAALARRGGTARVAVGAAAALAVVGMLVATHRQIPHWRDSEAVFTRALDVTERNFVAHAGLGFTRAAQNDPAGAVPHFEEALRLNAGHTRARVGLAHALVRIGRSDEAIPLLERAVRDAPDDRVARNNLGVLLVDAGRAEEARPHLERARALAAREGVSFPPHAQRALGDALAAAGDSARALALYETALRALPDDALLHAKAGLMAHVTGQPRRAVTHYRAALSRAPSQAEVANNLAWLLATCAEPDVRDGKSALALVDALARENGSARLLDTLAASEAAVGRFQRAVDAADRAIAAARAADDADLEADARAHRAEFAASRALSEPCGRPSGS